MIVLVRKDPSLAGPDPGSVADQSASPLLALPAELRNAIWSNLLVHSTATDASASSSTGRQQDGTPARDRNFCANVLRTCKMINIEATPILYGENTYSAHPSLLSALPSFMLRIRPTRISLRPVTTPRVMAMIRRYYIHVRLDIDPRFSKSQVEESFCNVEELEIEVFQAMYGSCDFSTLKLFEGVRGVGKAVVQGSVGDGKYADYLARCMMSEPGADVPTYSEKYIGGNKAWDAWQHGNR